jgi:hypothetical protein
MNAPFNRGQPPDVPQIPLELQALTPRPLVLPGEKLEQYQLMGQAIIAEIAPRSAVEWLLALEAVELSWDIQSTGSFAIKFWRPIASKPSNEP